MYTGASNHPAPSRAKRPTRPCVAIAATLALSGTLAACSSDDASAPNQTTAAATTPAVAPTAADTAASKAVAAAAAALTQSGTAGQAARDAAFTGPALASANALAKAAPALSAAQKAAVELDPSAAKVLAISRAGVSPTQVLVNAKLKSSGAAVLALLTGAGADSLKVAALTPMLAGATLEPFDAPGIGSAPVPTSGLALTPDQLLTQFAASVAYPKPADAPGIADNALTKRLRDAAAADAKALGTTGVLTQAHTPGSVVGGLSLAGNAGAVVFVQLDREDALVLRGSQPMTPAKDVQLITGVTKIASEAQLRTTEVVAFVVPPAGKARIVAASEQLTSGTGK